MENKIALGKARTFLEYWDIASSKAVAGARVAVNSRWLPWAIITLGILFRAIQYLSNHALWLDEATLGLNIVNRGFLGLLEQLDNYELRPVGFLMIERLNVRLFGNNEYALRLFPFSCGVVSMLLFYRVAKEYVRPGAVILSLALFAISNHQIFYSALVRQYASDLAIALVLLWLASILRQRGMSSRIILLAAVIGAASVWFSFTAVFLLAGLGTTLAIVELRRRSWKKVGALGAAGILWLLSFSVNYFLFVFPRYDYFARVLEPSGIFMRPEFSASYLGWLMGRVVGMFSDPLGLSQWAVPLFASLLGCVWMMSEDRTRLAILLSPLLFALFASGLGRFPFSGRYLVFAVPAMLLLIAQGVVGIAERSRDRSALASTALIFALVSPQLATALPTTPLVREEIRPVMAYLSAHYESGDVIYLYSVTTYAFRYYAPKFGLADKEYIIGVFSRDDWKKYQDDLEKLRGHSRVWLLFTHVWYGNGVDEEKLYLYLLDGMGKRLDSFSAPGAVVYLYDLQ